MSKSLRFFIAFSLSIAFVGPNAFAAPFSLDNLVVVQIGDGSAAGGQGTFTRAELREYTTTGSLEQSIELPTASSGSNYALTINRLTDAGGLTRSADGHYLVVGGTDAAPRTTPANPVGRVIGRIDSAGNIDTSTRITDAYGAETNNSRGIRTAVSVDGSSFWTSGDGSGDIGVRYVTLGGTTSTAISDPTAASRHLTIFDGQLYNSNGTARTVGVGLPTSGPVEFGTLDGLPFGPANSPVFLDLNPLVDGPDTLYVGFEGTTSLAKYTFDGTTWTAGATYSEPAIGGLLYLTGRLEDGKVAIYGTTRTAGNPSFGNSLVKLVDEGDSYSLSVLATADANYTFRGIAFTPTAIPEPSTMVLALLGAAAAVLTRWRKR